MKPHRALLFIVPLLLISSAGLRAQVSFGKNLLVNGDAEAGSATNGGTVVASIPGWTATGSPNVILYSANDRLSKTSIGPASRGNNYFAGGPNNAKSVLTQKVDLTVAASGIDAGKISYDVSGYLGGDDDDNSSMLVTFQGASGSTTGTVTLGPVLAADKNDSEAVYLRRAIGLVPSGTRSVTVELDLNRSSGTANDAAADNLSFILTDATAAPAFFGSNLIVNGNADAPTGSALGEFALDLPGWVRTAGFSVDAYGLGGSDLDKTDPGPSDRGANFFFGGPGSEQASATQDIDISQASAQIDAGKVTFTFAGWVGGYSSQGDNITVTAQFMNWAGAVLSTSTLGPVTPVQRSNASSLLQRSQTGTVPAGTRWVRVKMNSVRTDGSDNDGLADSLSLVLGTGSAPAIQSGGVVSASAFGGFSAIAPGTWVEIYGSNLATDTREWAGADFSGNTAPTALNGTKVTVGGQQAFVRFVSPGQVNVQIPSNVAAGTQQLTVTNGNGTSNSYPIVVNATQAGLLAPSSFNVGGKQYVVALHADGAYVLPAGAIPGVASRQAQPGETILLYGIGFGTVTPNFPAGQIVTGTNQLSLPFQVQLGSTAASLSYAGLAPSFVGLYQFNVVVPNISDSDAVPLSFSLGGAAGSQTLYTAVKR